MKDRVVLEVTCPDAVVVAGLAVVQRQRRADVEAAALSEVLRAVYMAHDDVVEAKLVQGVGIEDRLVRRLDRQAVREGRPGHRPVTEQHAGRLAERAQVAGDPDQHLGHLFVDRVAAGAVSVGDIARRARPGQTGDIDTGYVHDSGLAANVEPLGLEGRLEDA